MLWKICHWLVLIFLLYNKFACCICRLVLEAMDGRFLNDSYQRPCPEAGPDAAPKQPVSQRTLKVIILLYGRLCFILRPKVCKGIIYHMIKIIKANRILTLVWPFWSWILWFTWPNLQVSCWRSVQSK